MASWEIKAARAAALQSQDVEEDVNEFTSEDANEGTAVEGSDSGLLIDISTVHSNLNKCHIIKAYQYTFPDNQMMQN